MMGQVSSCRGFRSKLHYCLEDKRLVQGLPAPFKDRAEILYYHQCYGGEKELSRQFREVVHLNRNILKPVMHVSLSLPPGEPLPKSKLVQLAKECASHMDFEKHQYVVILHKDTPHQHIHLVANRIGFDGHVTSDCFTLGRVNEYCRAAELRHGLRQTLGPYWFRNEEGRQLPHHDLRLDRLKENIHRSLLLSSDLEGFKASMEERGYKVYRREKGFAFMDDKQVLFRGYEAGYPFHRIQSILSEDLSLRQERERQRLEEELRLKQGPDIREEQTQRQHQKHSHRLRL
jgi:hypothetical protein